VFGNSASLFWSSIVDMKARTAFEILVRENSRMLLVYLHSLVRDEAAVDDLFQETMVVAWRRLDECDLDRPFGPWLRGIASRLVLAHYRKQKIAPVLLHESVLQVVDRYFENINLLAGDTWDDKLTADSRAVGGHG
jgi:RNA polymerase sigma-70 factor (ECF subfamily)